MIVSRLCGQPGGWCATYECTQNSKATKRWEIVKLAFKTIAATFLAIAFTAITCGWGAIIAIPVSAGYILKESQKVRDICIDHYIVPNEE